MQKWHKFNFYHKITKYIFQEVYILKIIDFGQGTKPWEHFQYKSFSLTILFPLYSGSAKKIAKYIFQEVYILKIIDFWQGTKPWEHFQYTIFQKNVKSENLFIQV